MKKPLTRIFIPNRGEIACRLIAACHKLSLTPIVGFSVADSASRAVRLASESICIGDADARQSYLNIERVLAAAESVKADAIHPGYGFLSEYADFARQATRRGFCFIGPDARAMRKLGDKVQAKQLARSCRIPLLEDISFDERELRTATFTQRLKPYLRSNQFPLLVKAAGGGGGRGMRVVQERSQLEEQMQAASREAKNLFNDGTIFIEPYIIGARHVEVQVIADATGATVALGTRDCSLQRRHQKVIEEAPASQLSTTLRNRLHRAAEQICSAATYRSLATVEFLVTSTGRFYFLEVNTRLQVEHPVTELSTGLDLVALQIQVAQGQPLSKLLTQRRQRERHALEVRLCAEIPELDFRASTGPVVCAEYPDLPGVRVDFGIESGDRISHHYDSLIAKIITSGKNRDEALRKMQSALAQVVISPPRTNLGYLRALLDESSFGKNKHTLLTAGEVLESYSAGYRHRLVIALIVAAQQRSINLSEPNSRHSPWYSDGHSGRARIQSSIGLRVGSEYYQVQLTARENLHQARIYSGDRCLLDTTSIDLSGTNGDTWHFTDPEGAFSGKLIPGGSHLLTVECQGDLFPVELASARSSAREATSKDGRAEVRAHLPGKIVSVSAIPGKVVDSGLVLIVLESMKMEHILAAPTSGTVTELYASSGQSVAAGDLLAVIIAEKKTS